MLCKNDIIVKHFRIYDVSTLKDNSGSKFYFSIITGSGAMAIFLYVVFEQTTPTQILIKALAILGKDSS